MTIEEFLSKINCKREEPYFNENMIIVLHNMKTEREFKFEIKRIFNREWLGVEVRTADVFSFYVKKDGSLYVEFMA